MKYKYVLKHEDTGNYYRGLLDNQSSNWVVDLNKAHLHDGPDQAFHNKNALTLKAFVVVVVVAETRTL